MVWLVTEIHLILKCSNVRKCEAFDEAGHAKHRKKTDCVVESPIHTLHNIRSVNEAVLQAIRFIAKRPTSVKLHTVVDGAKEVRVPDLTRQLQPNLHDLRQTTEAHSDHRDACLCPQLVVARVGHRIRQWHTRMQNLDPSREAARDHHRRERCCFAIVFAQLKLSQR